MTIAAVEIQPLAVDVAFSGDMLQVELADGRAIGVPLEWFPDLEASSAAALVFAGKLSMRTCRSRACFACDSKQALLPQIFTPDL